MEKMHIQWLSGINAVGEKAIRVITRYLQGPDLPLVVVT